MDVGEYKKNMSDWVDEVAPLAEGFRSMFPDTTEGLLKYIFAVNFMVLYVCLKRGIPEEAFGAAVRTIVGTWFIAGKPEGMEFFSLRGGDMGELEKAIRAIVERGGEKPSSDA